MKCTYCDEEILPGEESGPNLQKFHKECVMRMVIGSVAHQKHECSCYVHGTNDDKSEEGKTPRQAAKAAYDYFRQTHPEIFLKGKTK